VPDIKHSVNIFCQSVRYKTLGKLQDSGTVSGGGLPAALRLVRISNVRRKESIILAHGAAMWLIPFKFRLAGQLSKQCVSIHY
jgi:hypothetical protein